jgi:hypothetical protein
VSPTHLTAWLLASHPQGESNTGHPKALPASLTLVKGNRGQQESMSFTVTSQKGKERGFRTYRQAEAWAKENAAQGYSIRTIDDRRASVPNPPRKASKAPRATRKAAKRPTRKRTR